MNLSKRRWLVLIASCLINLCIGALYAWSVFATPMAEHINTVKGFTGEDQLTSASLAIVFSVANSVGPITMIGGGKLVRTIGPRKVIMIGGIWFGIGMLICGFASSLAVLLIGYGICCGLAMGMTYGCTVSNAVKFFPDKRGLAGGLATASYGLSSVIVPLISTALISGVGVSWAFRVLGIAVVVLVVIASIFVLPCPDGFVPEGYTPPMEEKKSSGKDYKWFEMIKAPIFYVMMILMMCGAFMGMMIISQASNIAQGQIQMTKENAAVVVSVLALFNTGGRILGGFISDRIGSIKTLMLFLLISIVGLLLLVFSTAQTVAMFYIGVCIIGICFGGFMGIYPGFTNQRFGAKYSSVNYGIMFIGFAIAGFCAPIIIGSIKTATKSYVPAYYVAIGLSVLGLVLSVVYILMEAKKKIESEESIAE